MAFEPADSALHGVALPVDVGVEGRRPAALGPLLAPVGVLVDLRRDGRLDPAPTQVPAVGLAGVGLVRQHPIRPGAGRTATEAGYPNLLQDRDELGTVPALTTGQQHSERFAALLAGQVKLGGPATP